MVPQSSNMKAVLVLLEHKEINHILSPFINIERDTIDWDNINYHQLSGGFQAALSWAYCLFCDQVPPVDWLYRDPFDSFGVMDTDLQILCLKGLGSRHELFVDK